MLRSLQSRWYHCRYVSNSGRSDNSGPLFAVDDIPPSFIEQHRECCARFMNWQTATILSNIATFDDPLDEAAMERHRQTKRRFAVCYVTRFCWRAIEDSERVVPAAAEQVQLTAVLGWNISLCCWYLIL